jgi:membrane protein required for colicin V production
MNTTDYVLTLLVLISIVVGVWRGFLREVISFVTWVAALLLAWQLGPLLEPRLGGLLAGEDVRPWAARIIIFILVLLIGAGLGAVLNHVVRLSIFSGTDRFLGGIFGALRGVVVIGVLAIFGQLLELEKERWWQRSVLMPYAIGAGELLQSVTGATLEAARAEGAKI